MKTMKDNYYGISVAGVGLFFPFLSAPKVSYLLKRSITDEEFKKGLKGEHEVKKLMVSEIHNWFYKTREEAREALRTLKARIDARGVKGVVPHIFKVSLSTYVSLDFIR